MITLEDECRCGHDHGVSEGTCTSCFWCGQRAAGAAPDLWVSDPLPGGYVCSVCHVPVESEPCREHQAAPGS